MFNQFDLLGKKKNRNIRYVDHLKSTLDIQCFLDRFYLNSLVS